MKPGRVDFLEKLEAYEGADRERILEALEWSLELCAAPEGQSNETSSFSEAGVSAEAGVAGLETASILAELNLDAETLIAALLHDVYARGHYDRGQEKDWASDSEIEKRFGRPALLLTESAARISMISPGDKTAREAEKIRKMLFAMAADIRVIFIKLAGTLRDMRALEKLPPAERKRRARECLDIYAPLADRLGLSWIKDELEDLSLKNLNREVFTQIREIVALKKNSREAFLKSLRESIEKEAAALNIACEVESRAKHFYSIYLKMKKRNKSAGGIYDLFGLRILCGSVENCYALLGMVHRLWKPMDGRFKDYIAMPKSNGYQSLHTTVFASINSQEPGASGRPFPWSPMAAEYGPAWEGGIPLEIQIRTFGMHRIAKYGAASHWLYKKGPARDAPPPLPEEAALLSRLQNWRLEESEGGERALPEDLKRELLRDSIYVFTPRGKVIELPAGATPIDFAYAIHTAIGERCYAAKADGAIIPLDRKLGNTQVVEILSSASARPRANWLNFVKTAKARNKIRAWLQAEAGAAKAAVASAAAGKIAAQSKKETREEAAGAAKTDWQPSHAAAKAEIQRRVLPSREQDSLRVIAGGEKNMLIRLAKCCNPAAGDAITGYVSRGRGVVVHRKNCRGLKNIPGLAERLVDVEWESGAPELVRRFSVKARFSSSLFSEIESTVRRRGGRLIEGRLDETGDGRMSGFFIMRLEQPGDLKKILKKLRGIPELYSIREFGKSENPD
jgi:GTP pyrophosphokinase